LNLCPAGSFFWGVIKTWGSRYTRFIVWGGDLRIAKLFLFLLRAFPLSGTGIHPPSFSMSMSSSPLVSKSWNAYRIVFILIASGSWDNKYGYEI
jgi:hypothetical protein